jgi:hypothetical protein
VAFSTTEGKTKAMRQGRGLKETLFSILALIGFNIEKHGKMPKESLLRRFEFETPVADLFSKKARAN